MYALHVCPAKQNKAQKSNKVAAKYQVEEGLGDRGKEAQMKKILHDKKVNQKSTRS